MTKKTLSSQLSVVSQALALALLLTASAVAADKILTFGVPVNDMRQSAGLTASNSITQGQATSNQTSLQAKIDAAPSGQKYPWYFSPQEVLTHTGYRRIGLVHTLVIPPGLGGRTWCSQGVGTQQGSGNLYTSTLQLDARQTYVKTTFDGTTNKLTSSGAGATVIVTGRTVDDRLDLDGSVYISGGTGVTAGWYGIASVNEGANTWTLDRNWCSGLVTNGTGYYMPDMIRDYAKGNVYQSLRFVGAGDDPVLKQGVVGLHFYGYPGVGAVNGAKAELDKVLIDKFEVGILCGRHLAEYNGSNSSDQTWAGKGDNNADHLVVKHSTISNCKSAFVSRNEQSVGHTFEKVRVEECETFIDAEAGGKIFGNHIHLEGPDFTKPYHRLLKIGRGQNEGTAFFSFRDTSMDQSCWNPQLVVSDWSDLQTIGLVIIDGCKIQRLPTSNLPLVDIHGGITLILTNISMGESGITKKGRLMAGDLKLRDGPNGVKCHVIIQNSWLGENDMRELINDDSTAGHTIDFRCVKQYDSTIMTDRRMVTTKTGSDASGNFVPFTQQ